jgi:hypothetical protein
MRFLWTAAVLAGFAAFTSAVPDGFQEKQIFKDGFMTDMAFTSQDTMFVTQKLGLVHVYEPGADYDYDDKTTAIDISNMVCYENERGLGGIQLHPNFDTNNWV